jgi:hypothetical protein
MLLDIDLCCLSWVLFVEPSPILVSVFHAG